MIKICLTEVLRRFTDIIYVKLGALFLGHTSNSTLVKTLGMSHNVSTNGSRVLELQVSTMFLGPKLEAIEKKTGYSLALKWRPAS